MSEINRMVERGKNAIHFTKCVFKYWNIRTGKIEYENKEIDKIIKCFSEREHYEQCEILKQFYKK